jgi:hypothetical protein
MSVSKISDEVAQQQLDLLLDFYEIEIGDVEKEAEFYDEGGDEVQKAIKGACDRLKRYIRKGLVEINETDGLTIVQYLRCPDGEFSTVSYRVIDGIAKQEMRWAKENDFYGKIYYLMGSLSKKSASIIAKFRGVDSSVVECLGAIFLTA